MADDLLLRRGADLYRKSQESCVVAASAFLTPAEQYALKNAAVHMGYDNLIFCGGGDWTERRLAVFLPYYMTAEDFEANGYICALKATARFASPGHRDYLGAVLNLGIGRECLGDICIFGEEAYLFCLPAVAEHILLNLDRVGRNGVKLQRVPLDAVPVPERKVKSVSFTVKSMRLDAVASGLFGVSRTAMAELVAQGLVSLNYSVCEKADAGIRTGDIISVRGYGKAMVAGCGDLSRKGRIFVDGEVYI